MSIPPTTISALTEVDMLRIGNRLDDLVQQLVPRDRYGVPQVSLAQRDAINDFQDWLDENFGPYE